jgi:hypothetical protein
MDSFSASATAGGALRSGVDIDACLENDESSPIRGALISRLRALGIDRGLVPGLIRNLAAAHRIHPHLNLPQFNRRLHYLGWIDLDLDYHTWQLARAYLESDGYQPTIQ